jgi:hemoglobin
MSPKTRAELTAEIATRTGIDDTMIDRLVRAFYALARADALLGPVFASRIADDEWEPHIERINAFWSSVALMTGEYHGRPMQLHIGLPVDAEHFDRWLALFEATAAEVCSPDAAPQFIERARRIASSFELAIAVQAGALPRRGERFHRRAACPVQQGDPS